MKAAVYGKRRQMEASVVAEGLEALGYAVSFRTHGYFQPEDLDDSLDVVATFGQRVHSGAVAEAYRDIDVPVITIDLPPIRTEDEAFRSLWLDRVNWVPDGPLPVDRLEAMERHGISVYGLDGGRGADVLICGQARGDAAHSMDLDAIESWARTVVRAVGDSERSIWRPHPQTPFKLGGVRLSDPAEEDFEEAFGDPAVGLVATFNSTCGVTALLRGVPVVCSPTSFYSEIAETSLERVNAPRIATDERRVGFFSRLAYAQWTADEIASGEGLAFVLSRAGRGCYG